MSTMSGPPSAGSASKQMPCLICGQIQVKKTFLAHISEHLSYRQHKCKDCGLETITAEEMAEHEANNPEHQTQLYALRNSYMDRVCRFIYNDSEYGERNGGLVKVLKRKLTEDDCVAPPTPGHFKQQYATASSTLPSPKVSGAGATNSSNAPALIIDPQHHQWIAAAANTLQPPQQLYQQFGQTGFSQATATTGEPGGAIYFVDNDTAAVMGAGGTSTGPAGHHQSILDKFIAEQQQTMSSQMFVGNHHYNAASALQSTQQNQHQVDQQDGLKNKQPKKKYKEVFENVQCLKCGQWVKGRGICLLYHMNTRHLKLPLYRCRACPRDFFYVTDTTAKNHIRSFHANDLSLLENNYQALSKILHDSRKDFYGPSKSEKRGMMRGSKKSGGMNAAAAINCPGGKGKMGKKKGKKSGHHQAKPAKEINVRERPQAGSGMAGNSSHIQCNQCGEFVATIYSSQLSHINTKHLHLPIYQCRVCDRTFEALSTSAAVMHIKSLHSKKREEAEAEIIDRRDECLRQLNERYRAFFN